jgi:hypothetical protein
MENEVGVQLYFHLNTSSSPSLIPSLPPFLPHLGKYGASNDVTYTTCSGVRSSIKSEER